MIAAAAGRGEPTGVEDGTSDAGLVIKPCELAGVPLAAEGHLAGARLVKAKHAAHGGGLARTVGAEEASHLPVRDSE